MTWKTWIVLVGMLLSLAAFTRPSQAQSNGLTGVVVNGKKFTGKILFRDSESLGLLRRDGGLSIYPSGQIELQKALGKPFRPYSQDELEERLRGEYPTRYSFVFTDHFAVVFPTNSDFAWATTFERMYRLFAHYFEARGMGLSEPDFPLIAVVLRTRAEFDQELEDTALSDTSNIRGFYSLKSNRIYTYDQALSHGGSAENSLTVIHEATHQSAYNTGVHDRFQPLPRWVSEGLAAMFEAPGVYNSIEFPDRKDRVAPHYMRDLRSLIDDDEFRGKIQQLVVSDELFESDPQTAYALAWGLTFFLSENRAQSYREYLQHGSQDYGPRMTSEKRLANFRSAFGNDLRDLETRMLQFFDEESLVSR